MRLNHTEKIKLDLPIILIDIYYHIGYATKIIIRAQFIASIICLRRIAGSDIQVFGLLT